MCISVHPSWAVAGEDRLYCQFDQLLSRNSGGSADTDYPLEISKAIGETLKKGLTVYIQLKGAIGHKFPPDAAPLRPESLAGTR
jgi:hypothetical protein